MRGKISAKMKFVLVVLEVVAALLRCSPRELVGDDLPVSAVDLEELDEFLLFVSLPLVLGLDAAAEERRLVHRACDLTGIAATGTACVTELVRLLLLDLVGGLALCLAWGRVLGGASPCYGWVQLCWKLLVLLIVALAKKRVPSVGLM